MRTGTAPERGAVPARTRSLNGRGRSRRRFLRRLAGLAVTLPGAALLGACGPSPSDEPRPARLLRIGYLDPSWKTSSADELAAFLDELRELGYGTPELVERYAQGRPELLPELAADLIGQAPDVLLAFGSVAIRALVDRTGTIPIVMAASSDPVGTGLVASLARPGGNVTGLTSIAPQLTGKRLQILTHAFPEVKRVAYLMDPWNPGDEEEERRILAVHQQLGVDGLHQVDVTPGAQLQPNLARAMASGAQALVTFASAAISGNPLPILQFATQHRLPAMYAQADLVTEHDGLMAYGPDYHDMYRRAAVFVDKILRGRSPAELPVEKPRRFTLLLNGTSAQAQGFVLPRSFLAQVDEVV